MDAILFRSSSLSMSKASLCHIFVLLVFTFFASPRAWAVNVEEFDISSDYEMDRRFDWTITVKTTIDNAALNYPTSTLKPLAKLSCEYRLCPRLSPDGVPKPMHYEDLF